MYPLSTPSLELYVAGLEMVNASSREHDSSVLFRGLAPSLCAMVLWDFSTSPRFDQCRNLIPSDMWEVDPVCKNSDHAISDRDEPSQWTVMRPASRLENDRSLERSPAICRGQGCYGVLGDPRDSKSDSLQALAISPSPEAGGRLLFLSPSGLFSKGESEAEEFA